MHNPMLRQLCVDAVQECGSTKAYTTIPCSLATSGGAVAAPARHAAGKIKKQRLLAAPPR